MNPTRDPVSWLTLECYAVGELPQSQRAEVERALASDEAARECLARIRSDVRVLPPLPVVGRPLLEERSWWASFGWSASVLATTLALLVLWPRVSGPALGPLRAASPTDRTSVKGGAVAISLVRERDGSVAWDPTLFASGDRFKVRVTCGMRGAWVATVVVHQDSAASHPLPDQAIACGNSVVLAGAFRLTGSRPARVCVLVSSGDPNTTEQPASADRGAANTACITVNPVR